MPGNDPGPLQEFVHDGAARIARLAGDAIAGAVPPSYRSAAASVARQAHGDWTVRLVLGDGFATDLVMRTMRIGEGFEAQCSRVVDTVTSSANPELARIVAVLGGGRAARRAIMSAFFHYFAAHEFVHVEQGLGSDQYRDSDFYMPVVMEADHVADVAGLVIAVAAGIPELAPLTSYQTLVTLMAIHIAAMHGFAPSRRADPRPRGMFGRWFGTSPGLDAHTFSRLLVWYLHFARVTKAGASPVLDSPEFTRSWIVMLPRLVASDRLVTLESVAERGRRPYRAGSDIVVAYHGEDGLYRIHRAAFTDVERTHRLCVAVLQEDFDGVRAELEELLVYNPALVPADRPRNLDVEWITAGLIETLDQARAGVTVGKVANVSAALPSIMRDFGRLSMLLQADAVRDWGLHELIEEGRRTLDELRREAGAGPADAARVSAWLLRFMSIVDQVAVSIE